MDKCAFPDGVSIKPDGVNELDPCIYEDIAIYTKVDVIVSRCVKCGHMEFMWKSTEETEKITLEGQSND